MLIYSLLIGAITGVAGMYLSYLFNAASGATIVLFGASLFCLSASIKRIRGKFMLRANLHRHGGLIHSHPHSGRHGMPDERKPE
ncbi:MAG: metal ABC transporter permease [Nitrosospira sp.]|nr:metal ABC transporter permease [Nitrosospira sp.]